MSSGIGPRIVLVTGGTRGIGASIAHRLGSEGTMVIVAARDAAACEEQAEVIVEGGGIAWPLRVDVSDPASVAEAAAQAGALAKEMGPIEGLVNNAGIAESAPLLPPDADLFERHLAVNLHGARRMVEALLPDMKATGFGRIVNVASSAGLRGYAYVSAYCASKFALVGYTLAAAAELQGTGVTVNAVCPHYVDTPMLERSVQNLVQKTGKSEEEARAFFRAENPGGRLVTPAQVTGAVVGLLRGEENGALVELDGSDEPRLHHPNDRGPGDTEEGSR
jgi:NAD(P)-dependent dehydrogenase (short-subunit alcohol dehydrogenase family)